MINPPYPASSPTGVHNITVPSPSATPLPQPSKVPTPSPLSPPSPTSSDSDTEASTPSSLPTSELTLPFTPASILPPPHVTNLPSPPSLPTLTGRTNQRYHDNRRLICGCVPFRLIPPPPSTNPTQPPTLQLLALRSLTSAATQTSDWIFPKGGWESFETAVECAARESMEEAGVSGRLVGALGEVEVGKESKGAQGGKRGRMWMWLMQVECEYEDWNDRACRERRWMSIEEARRCIQRVEMKVILERAERMLEVKMKELTAASAAASERGGKERMDDRGGAAPHDQRLAFGGDGADCR